MKDSVRLVRWLTHLIGILVLSYNLSGAFPLSEISIREIIVDGGASLLNSEVRITGTVTELLDNDDGTAPYYMLRDDFGDTIRVQVFRRAELPIPGTEISIKGILKKTDGHTRDFFPEEIFIFATHPWQSDFGGDLKKLIICGSNMAMEPGESGKFSIGYLDFSWIPPETRTVRINAEWSISPQTDVSIDKETGEVSLGKAAKNGTKYKISAKVGNGVFQRELMNQFTVLDPGEYPFAGMWQEKRNWVEALLSSECEIIREFVFHADGTFTLTFYPFETFHDCWGNYRNDLEKHTIEFEITGGNNVPAGGDLKGRFSLAKNGSLRLRNLSFGEFSENNPAKPAFFGYRFERFKYDK